MDWTTLWMIVTIGAFEGALTLHLTVQSATLKPQSKRQERTRRHAY